MLAAMRFLLSICLSSVACGAPSGELRASRPGGGRGAETDLLRSDLWDDGLAEVARYVGTERRYGELRDAELVLIVVKEPFDADLLVKADGEHHEHVLDAIKLNAVVTVPTGVYTYHQMASAFFEREGGRLMKLATTSQEWCGITTKLLTVRGEDAVLRAFSYFGDEAESIHPFVMRDDMILEDTLPLYLRTLDFERESARELAIVPRQLSNRAAFPAPTRATATIGARETIEVPAGAMEALRVEVRGAGTDVYWFASEVPHVLVRWDRADGGRYELASVLRTDYWAQHDVGDALPPLPNARGAQPESEPPQLDPAPAVQP